MLCVPFWTLCLTSRGYPHETEGELGWKEGGKTCFARSQNVFCVSPALIYFSVINLFLYAHCNVETYQPAMSSRTLPHRHVRRRVRVGHVSFNNKGISKYDDNLFIRAQRPPSSTSFTERVSPSHSLTLPPLPLLPLPHV